MTEVELLQREIERVLRQLDVAVKLTQAEYPASTVSLTGVKHLLEYTRGKLTVNLMPTYQEKVYNVK